MYPRWMWQEGLQRAEPRFECGFRTWEVFWFGVGVGSWVRVGLMRRVLYTSRLSGWRALGRVRGGEGGRKQANYGAVTCSAPHKLSSAVPSTLPLQRAVPAQSQTPQLRITHPTAWCFPPIPNSPSAFGPVWTRRHVGVCMFVIEPHALVFGFVHFRVRGIAGPGGAQGNVAPFVRLRGSGRSN